MEGAPPCLPPPPPEMFDKELLLLLFSDEELSVCWWCCCCCRLSGDMGGEGEGVRFVLIVELSSAGDCIAAEVLL